jgi:hypothetical protein
MSTSLRHHSVGISWCESGMMPRAAHAVVDDGRVWLIDPFADGPGLAAAAELGEPAAVIQLLDRHQRDGESIAADLGVPLLRLPETVAHSPFEVISVVSRPKWQEIALWWAAQRTLIVAEAIGTAPLFALGRGAGVHPLLRVLPPRSALGGYAPQRLLVGHGPPLDTDAAAALDTALARARGDIPRLLTRLPQALMNR